ncbi:hypothetical protein MYX04_08520, partial [Nitrospiraceae bacterium AH_259_D15_M11_P09]|nr:hypothetical protein [Nitrospiraceae bacterium AH_259_D15_M11_P09]
WDSWLDLAINFPDDRVTEWRLWRWLEKAAPCPDLRFLFLISVEESIKRAEIKGEPFRDPPEVLARRLEFYQGLAREDGWHWLDGTETPEKVFEVIISALDRTTARPTLKT